MEENKYALQMQNITVKFPGVLANDNVSIDCKKGEVLGLLGENGAGKTTLMNVLYGLYPPSSGKILLDGKEVQIGSPSEAISHGVGMVHQHFKLVDTLSVIEMSFSASPPKSRFWTWNPPGRSFWSSARSMSCLWIPTRSSGSFR